MHYYRNFYVRLQRDEFEALCIMAKRDFRNARDHLRWLIRQEAQRRGLLQDARQEEEDGERAPKAA